MNTDLVRQDALSRRKFLGTLAAGALIPSLTVSAVPASLSLIQSVLGEAMPAPIAKALIVIGDATETVDTLYPYYRLIEAGIQPVVIAPEKRLYQMVMHEIKPGWTITKEWEGYTLEANLAFSQVKEEEYLGIMFSGGRAPEYIRYDKDLVRMTKYFFAQNKPVASVCHGVEIPAYADCVRGRRMATVAKCRFDLESCGGIYVNEPCVVDGNLVSGRTFHDNGQYLGPWIRMLEAARDKNLTQATKQS